ncbi:MAG: phosphate/phosphite/phosphonate ABC transporter substrate-binding protein [Sulfuricellaceae bacterium]|nr:phosphate/phosphite/phosphonate ABC transporter substrate-binding protein [Sulfuricellaceae bacterium]
MNWIAILLVSMLPLTAGASERLLLGVNTGVPAQDEQRDLADKYKPLADYLASMLKRPVKLDVSQNISAAEKRLKKDAFDLFFGPPQVVAQAIKSANYVPIARYPGKIKAAFVVMDSSGIKTMAETRGKRLCLPDKESLASHLAQARFRSSKINPDNYYSEVFYQRFQDSTLNALKIGRVEVAVVTAGFAKKWMKDNPGARILEETGEAPQFTLAVSEDFGKAETARVQSVLLNAANTPEGQAMLEKLGRKDGFVATDMEEYGPVISLFGL